jgi:hypothetical protein
MKPFTFLSAKHTFNGIEFDPDIISAIYELCEIYNDFIDRCRINFLDNNPEIDPQGEFTFPIPHNPIERNFPEGKLWHGGSDWSEETQKLEHMVFLDRYDSNDGDYYYFIVDECNDGNLSISGVEMGNNWNDYDPSYE